METASLFLPPSLFLSLIKSGQVATAIITPQKTGIRKGRMMSRHSEASRNSIPSLIAVSTAVVGKLAVDNKESELAISVPVFIVFITRNECNSFLSEPCSSRLKGTCWWALCKQKNRNQLYYVCWLRLMILRINREISVEAFLRYFI